MYLDPGDYAKSMTTHFRRASKDLYNSIKNDSKKVEYLKDLHGTITKNQV